MKLNASAIERFLQKPDPLVFAALFYGSDAGLVADRSKQLCAHWLDANDPFAEVRYTGGASSEAAGGLLDEMNAYSMGGGQRLVLIKNPDRTGIKEIADTIKALQKDSEPPIARLLIEAGALAPTSPLRKVFEAKATSIAVAMPCYPDRDGDVLRVSRDVLQAAGHAADRDALGLILASVPRDRAMLRSELEKLLLYMYDRPGDKITVMDVAAVLSPDGDASVDDLVRFCVSGDSVKADLALKRALDAGQYPGMLVRAIASQLHRINTVLVATQNGAGLGTAMGKLRPPVFIMHRDQFVSQCSKWSPVRLQKALTQALETERAIKASPLAPDSVLGRFVLAVSSLTN